MKMRKFLKQISVLIFFCTAKLFPQADSTISQIINQVNLDSLYDNLRILTGDKPVTLNGKEVTIVSRHKDSQANQYAADFIYNKFFSYGLNVSRQDFLTSGQNIFAYRYGKIQDEFVIICAHYDAMPSGGIAPGADDNGSGTAAVLEAARIFSKYQTNYTIIFALWDQEEQGLQGSAYYAQQAKTNGDKIISVINLDMIGWDSNNDGIMEIHTQNYASSNSLASQVESVNNNYNIGLTAQIINPGTTRSDHASFWFQNYSAVLLIEDFTKNSDGHNDFNNQYHKVTDNLANINKNYFQLCCKLAVGSLAQSAGVSVPTYVELENELPLSFNLSQNYPNPFNPSTTISYALQVSGYTTLKVYDLLGREVAVLVNEYQVPGKYNVMFNVGANRRFALQSGIYFYRLTTGNFTSEKKMLLLK